MKFPKIFLNHLVLYCGRLCQNWNGGPAAAWRSFWRSTNANASFRSTTPLSQSLT